MFSSTLRRRLATLAVIAGLLATAGPASASHAGPLIAPAHTAANNAPASFELVLDGIDIGWSSPTLSGIPANRGLPVTVPKLDGSSKDA
jgi:hypothetical protein